MTDPGRHVRLEINMDQPCRRCGAFGATPRGLCLECIGKEIAMPEQMSLTTAWVELTPEEQQERGRALADAVRELTLLDEEHKERKKAMAQDRAAHMRKLHELAYVVRVGKEERPVGIAR